MKKSLGAQTLVYPTPVWVVCTYSQDGQPNAMTVAWGGICCSSPPAVAISVRSSRLTYSNIKFRKAFTVNIPSEQHARQADYFGIVSGKNSDKIRVAGLTAVKSVVVDAPYIDEFPLVLECQLAHVFDLGAHTQFVGEIMDVKADQAVLGATGGPDITKAKPLVFCPDDTMHYHGIGQVVGRAFSMGKAVS